MASTEELEKVRGFTEGLLYEQFPEGFVFDPIVIVPCVDHYGDDYLEIHIVYDGEQKNLDPYKTIGLRWPIREQIEKVGLAAASPGLTFIPRNEWRTVFKNGAKLGRP